MKRFFAMACGVALLAAGVSAAGTTDEKLGKGVSLKDATSIKALYETPDKFVGKTIRIDGTATAVCEEMGCWMAIASKDDKDLVVRLKVEHSAGITFPITAKTKSVSAEGVFERIAKDDKEAQEAIGESTHATHSDKAAKFGAAYQIKATGAVIK